MLNHILVFIDEQPTSALMSHAIPLAQSSGASITLFGLHSLSRKAIDPVEWYLDQMEAELKLEGSIGALKDHHIPVHTVMLDRLESANLAQVIARYMVEAQVDLLVLPSRLHGLLLDPAISATGLAVSIVPDDIQIAAWPDRENAIRKIMIPLDCSLRAEYALPLASHLAHLTGAELLLAYAIGCTDIPPRLQHDSHVADLMNQVTAYKQLEGQRYLNQVQATLGDAASTRLLVHRNVRHALHDLALQEAVDMVILCAHGHSGNIQWPYGSVAQSFIMFGKVPLLIVQDMPSTRVVPASRLTEDMSAMRLSHAS